MTASVLTELGLGHHVPSTETPPSAPSDEAKATGTPAESKPDSKTEAKAEDKAKESSDAKAPDPDALKAENARLQKQLKDTRDAFTQERQRTKMLDSEMKAVRDELKIVNKKLDGTYDEATDKPKPPSDEEVKRAERVATSHWAAVDHYGEEYVMKTIWADDAPFRQFDADPAVQARVFASKTPILEAIKVVKEAETKAKYGGDPESMRKAIEQEMRTTIEKEVRQKVLKELKGHGDSEDVKGLANVRAATDSKASDKPGLNFENLFGNFQKTAG